MADIDRQITADEDRRQINAGHLPQLIGAVDVEQRRSTSTSGSGEHDDENWRRGTPWADADESRLLDEGQGERPLLRADRRQDS